MAFMRKFLPFVFLGIAIVAIAFGMLILFYLFVIGAVVGLVLYAIAWIKEKFFPEPKTPQVIKKSGRTIDSDDWKKL